MLQSCQSQIKNGHMVHSSTSFGHRSSRLRRATVVVIIPLCRRRRRRRRRHQAHPVLVNILQESIKRPVHRRQGLVPHRLHLRLYEILLDTKGLHQRVHLRLALLELSPKSKLTRARSSQRGRQIGNGISGRVQQARKFLHSLLQGLYLLVLLCLLLLLSSGC